MFTLNFQDEQPAPPFSHSRVWLHFSVILSSAAQPRAVEKLVLSEAEGTPRGRVAMTALSHR
jgi:hypothetical protein